MRVLRPREKSYSLLGVEVGTETRSHTFSPGIFRFFVRKIIVLHRGIYRLTRLSANKKTDFTSSSLAVVTSIPLALYSFILYYNSGR